MSSSKAAAPRRKRVVGPWDAARRRRVVRGNWLEWPAELEPGVKYFVLALERLGATTTWSCEGHPYGFYIVFQAPELLARVLDALGFFTIALCNQGWRLSLEGNEVGALRGGIEFTDEHRRRCLRQAAEAWEHKLGRLDEPLPPLRLSANVVRWPEVGRLKEIIHAGGSDGGGDAAGADPVGVPAAGRGRPRARRQAGG